ncbi:MAG TPA: tetratricopeptide repeat protein [Vicinamibacterales bacterium]|nr:tetratricopeptide repeat protein [Vicinamibacterales bacterium]
MGLGALFYPWGIVLQAVALLHFLRRRPEGYWFWIILVGGGLGALIYIVAEVVPDAALLRGVVNQFSRRRRIAELERIVIDNPAVGNLEELADLYLEERQFAKARALYDKVLARQTDTLDPFYRRGLAEIELGDAAAAVTDLDRVIAKEPKYDFNRGIGMLAHACALAGQTDRADALFQNAVAVSTLSETYYNYAAFLAGHDRPAEARAWAERILAKAPTMPRYLRRRERPWFRKAKALIKRLPTTSA